MRLGIIGSGYIAGKFADERPLFTEGAGISCVYNPRIAGAEGFAEKYGIEKVARDRDELFRESDIVYIASPHASHAAYAKEALLAGRHVLCEKPMAFRRAEAEEFYSEAGTRGLILMEGIKPACCPGFIALCDAVSSGIIGDIVDIEASFVRGAGADSKIWSDPENGGSLYELGSYTLFPLVRFMHGSDCTVRFDSVFSENGVDRYTKTYLSFEEKFGLSKTGLGAESEGSLIITGTDGYIKATAPWWHPDRFELFRKGEDPELFVFPCDGYALSYELNELVSRIREGRTEGMGVKPHESTAIADIMEKFRNWKEEKTEC